MHQYLDDNSIDRLSFLKLRYFLVVAQVEHITQAARMLQITQPALSKAIASIEEDLGVPLFVRTGNRITLNNYGTAVRQLAEKALEAVERLQQNANTTEEVTGTVRFMTSVISNKHLTQLLSGFHDRYPMVSFDVSTMHPYNKYTKAVDISDWDVVIQTTAIPLYKCVSIPIFSESFMIGVSKDHPFANRDHIALSECSSEKFLSLRQKTSYYKETFNLCAIAGFQPNIICYCDNTDIVQDLASQGVGIAIMPESSWGFTPKDLHLLTIDGEDFRRHYYLSRSRDKEMSPAASLFYDYTLEYYSNL